MSLRSSWEGYLKLNLLSVPVKAFNVAASSRSRISFHQIHAGCGSRIRHQKVCPIHGEVSKDDVVSGYEYTKGNYVIVQPEEIAKVRKEDEKTITIDVFVEPETIDPIYYTGRSFYLTPDGKIGQKPYEVIQHVMSDKNRHAVGQVVFSGRQQLAVVRPLENLLVMSMLSFDEEVKKISTFKDEAPDLKLSSAELELAESLIDANTTKDFDLGAYHDEYEEDLKQLIEAKANGKKLVAKRSAEAPAVINLMDALRKSLEQKQKPGAKHASARAHKRKTG